MEGQFNLDEEIIDVSNKFSSDLDLGITETLTTGSKDLFNFLISDPKDVKPIEEKPKEEIKDDKPKEEDKQPTAAELEAERVSTLNKYLEDDDKPVEQHADDKVKDDEPVDNKFQIIANELFEAGVFTKDEDDEEIEIASGEELLERFQLEKRKDAIEIVDNFISKYGDEYREMFDAVFVKGVKPEDYLKSYATLQEFENLDLASEDNQKRVYREYFKSQGFSSEQIEKRLQRVIDSMDLEEEAKTFHEKLVEKEKLFKQELEEKEDQKKQLQAQQDLQYHENLKKILTDKVKTKEFDGIPVTPKSAQEAYDFMYKKTWRMPSGEELTNFDKFLLDLKRPENHELRVKIGLLAMGNFDLTKVKASQDSKEKKKIFEGLDKTDLKKKIQVQQPNNQSKSFFD